MKHWNKIIALLCCAEVAVKGFLAYTEGSTVYAILAVLWLACTALYIGIVKGER